MNRLKRLGGNLFASEFLAESVHELPEWQGARADLAAGIATRLRDIRGTFPAGSDPNEAVTEDEFIWKVLGALGWTAALRQQNLGLHGHRDVPDGVLYSGEADKTQALGVRHPFLLHFGLQACNGRPTRNGRHERRGPDQRQDAAAATIARPAATPDQMNLPGQEVPSRWRVLSPASRAGVTDPPAPETPAGPPRRPVSPALS